MNDAYRNLCLAVIDSACQDFVKYKTASPQMKKSESRSIRAKWMEIERNGKSAEAFLHHDSVYFDYANIDRIALLEKLEARF